MVSVLVGGPGVHSIATSYASVSESLGAAQNTLCFSHKLQRENTVTVDHMNSDLATSTK